MNILRAVTTIIAVLAITACGPEESAGPQPHRGTYLDPCQTVEQNGC